MKHLTKEELKEQKIQEDNPSICYGCANARKPASDENRENGFTGCTVQDHTKIGECMTLGEGWVDLRAPVFGESSGIITNFRLLTKEVKNCKLFIER